MSRKALSFLVLAALGALACITSCSSPPPDNTTTSDITTSHPEVTPGYTLFQGDTEGLMVSFEYPESWVLDAPMQTSIGERMDLHFGYQHSITLQFSSSAMVYTMPQSSYSAPLSFHFKDASDLLEYKVSDVSSLPSFLSMSSGKYMLGNVDGEEATYSYLQATGESLKLQPYPYRNVIVRHIVADCAGRIYWVRMTVDTDIDNFEDYNPDFEHLLATFRFLE